MKQSPPKTGWIIITVFSVIPVILWFLSPRIQNIGSTFPNLLIGLGQIFGLVGIVLFSENIIIAARLHYIENMFNGLNNVYKNHNLLGQIAFILLLFHPLFLIPKYSSNFSEAAVFLFLGNSWPRNLGIIALTIMITLIILTLYLKPKYNLWKITHKFFGLALFLGALHAYFIPSYIMNNPILKIYVLFFAVLGIIAFLYRSILKNILPKKYKYTVTELKKLNNEIIEISLQPNDQKLNFNPGQFVFISFFQNNLSKESHPFSISSAPQENKLKITIKKLGDYTNDLFNNLQTGTIALIDGPFGVFSYRKYPNKNQIWLAGGVGITPFISFTKSLAPQNKYNIKLFYCVKNENEAIHLELFKKQALNNPNFQIFTFYSDQNGYINKEYITKQIPDLQTYDFFLCAPPIMIHSLKKQLSNKGIKINNIHSEEFNF